MGTSTPCGFDKYAHEAKIMCTMYVQLNSFVELVCPWHLVEFFFLFELKKAESYANDDIFVFLFLHCFIGP